MRDAAARRIEQYAPVIHRQERDAIRELLKQAPDVYAGMFFDHRQNDLLAVQVAGEDAEARGEAAIAAVGITVPVEVRVVRFTDGQLHRITDAINRIGVADPKRMTDHGMGGVIRLLEGNSVVIHAMTGTTDSIRSLLAADPVLTRGLLNGSLEIVEDNLRFVSGATRPSG